jgi:hypothetical protein
MRYPTDPVIHVDFHDANSGDVLAYTEIYASQLPEFFDATSTVKLGGMSWAVRRAEPTTAQEFRRTGNLKLYVTRAAEGQTSGQASVYTVPTVDEAAPAVEPDDGRPGKHIFRITPEDWRQIEFVGFTYEFRVDAELQSVRAIKQQSWNGSGYTSQHIRGTIPDPLAGSPVTVEEIIHVLGPGTRVYDGLGYQGVDGIIYGGFAILSPAMLHIYGTHDTNGVSVLGLFHVQPAPADEALAAIVWREVQALSDFMRRKRLCLVHWCDCVRIQAGHPDLFVFFGL